MVSVPKRGATVFAPLNEIIKQLPIEKYNEWNRLWMVSDRRTGPIHPLIYKHPKSGQEVFFFFVFYLTLSNHEYFMCVWFFLIYAKNVHMHSFRNFF